ncbi:MAG: hexose kinase [Armatimonadota bacterium]|nr:hexose kinase [Armatimonadota bacterium]
MILCVSPNLCYDRVVVVPGVSLGGVHRAVEAFPRAGGKGLNVARVVRELGEQPLVIGFAGGQTGHLIVRGARQDGIPLRPVRTGGESRTCTLIIDPGRSETVVNERGHPVSRQEERRLRRVIHRCLAGARIVAIAGSMPPGISEDFVADMVTAAGDRATIVDSPRESFRRALVRRPWVAKLNHQEVQETLGVSFPSVEDAVAAAREIRSRGARWAVITLGEHGALLATEEGVWHAHPPQVHHVSTVGAGDSLTAGLAVGLARGLPAAEALRVGVAAAAADVATLLPGTVNPEAVRQLLRGVQVRFLGS